MLPKTSSIDIQKDNDHGTSFISHMMFCPNSTLLKHLFVAVMPQSQVTDHGIPFVSSHGPTTFVLFW
jgi:hypothetical protein